jgi:glycosyltransferase involved in cell wall biosynthesis
MTKEIKTLQIAGDSKFGGGTYLILKWCRFLQEKGCEVDVLSTDPITVNELKKFSGINIIQNIYIPREIHLIDDLIAFLKLSRLLYKNRYDVVHTYSATPGLIGRISAKLERIPVILHHQAGWTVNEFSSLGERLLFTPLENIAVRMSTKSICVGEAVAKQAIKYKLAPAKKLIIIRNGIDPEPFLRANGSISRERLLRDWDLPENAVLIGSTARLSVQKDLATSIHALSNLNEMLPDNQFFLLIAGDGSERQTLDQLVITQGLKNRVIFCGFIKNIPEFLAGIDILISSTIREGLSISLLEAMASTKPIVATSILPNVELIEHEVTGLLVPPRDPKVLAESILRFVTEPDLAQSCAENARQLVLEKYTIERMFRETWNLYNQLLAKEWGANN